MFPVDPYQMIVEVFEIDRELDDKPGHQPVDKPVCLEAQEDRHRLDENSRRVIDQAHRCGKPEPVARPERCADCGRDGADPEYENEDPEERVIPEIADQEAPEKDQDNRDDDKQHEPEKYPCREIDVRIFALADAGGGGASDPQIGEEGDDTEAQDKNHVLAQHVRPDPVGVEDVARNPSRVITAEETRCIIPWRWTSCSSSDMNDLVETLKVPGRPGMP